MRQNKFSAIKSINFSLLRAPDTTRDIVKKFFVTPCLLNSSGRNAMFPICYEYREQNGAVRDILLINIQDWEDFLERINVVEDMIYLVDFGLGPLKLNMDYSIGELIPSCIVAATNGNYFRMRVGK